MNRAVVRRFVASAEKVAGHALFKSNYNFTQRWGTLMRPLIIAIASSLALASSAYAAAFEPPPPVSVDDKGVKAWLNNFITTQGWTIIAADGVAVSLGSPEGVGRLADGTLTTKIRHEYYTPVTLGDMQSRSNLQSWTVDCSGRRLKITVFEIYKGNNLTGGGERMSNPQVDWQPVRAGSQNERVIKRICEAPTTGKRLQ